MAGEDRNLRECESYVQEYDIQRVLKDCIVQVSFINFHVIDINLYEVSFILNIALYK